MLIALVGITVAAPATDEGTATGAALFGAAGTESVFVGGGEGGAPPWLIGVSGGAPPWGPSTNDPGTLFPEFAPVLLPASPVLSGVDDPAKLPSGGCDP